MNPISKNQRSRIYALLKNTGLKEAKEVLTLGFSDHRTEHISDLTTLEADAFIDYLAKQPQKTTPPKDPKGDRMRKKILHLLALQGFVTEGGSFDYERINSFIENIGSRNPSRKRLNKLSQKELQDVLTQIEQMSKKTKNKASSRR